jgi:hypothetical protein
VQRRFLADPTIVGRSFRLGLEQTTIVGVMPEGFRFPINHELWIPLRAGAIGGGADARPWHVFGRLMDNAFLESAQSELTTVGRRMAADAPETYAFVRPQVVPYAHLVFDRRNYQIESCVRRIHRARGAARGRLTGSARSSATRRRGRGRADASFLRRDTDQVGADAWLESQYVSRLLIVMSALALLLSLMAIYSVTAFTVVQRTREIGLRVALGASGGRVVIPVIARPLLQIGVGIVVGASLVVLTFVGMFSSAPTPGEAAMIAAYVVLMLAVSLLACAVPTRRALRLEPSQVLRAEA